MDEKHAVAWLESLNQRFIDTRAAKNGEHDVWSAIWSERGADQDSPEFSAVVPFIIGTSSRQQEAVPSSALVSAAAKGNPVAQYSMGTLSEANADFVRAESWYQRSAEQGYAAAQFGLAQMLETGKGVPAVPSLAMSWYQKAADQGFQPAVTHLKELADAVTGTPADASAPTPPVQLAPPVPPAPPADATAAATPPVADATAAATDTPPPPPAPEPPPQPAVAPPATAAPVQVPVPGAAASSGSEPWTPTEDAEAGAVVLYVLLSAYCGVRLIRPRLLDWYRSSWWFVSSSGRSDTLIGNVLLGGEVGQIFFKRVMMRLQVEGLALTLGTVVGCIGGNLYYLVKRRQANAAAAAAVREYAEPYRQRVEELIAENQKPEAVAANKAWHAAHASSILYQLTEVPGTVGYQEVHKWIDRDAQDFARAYEEAATKAGERGMSREDFDAQFKGEMRNAQQELEADARAFAQYGSTSPDSSAKGRGSTFINRL